MRVITLSKCYLLRFAKVGTIPTNNSPINKPKKAVTKLSKTKKMSQFCDKIILHEKIVTYL